MSTPLPLKFEQSNIFAVKSIAIRSDVHIMVSSGTFLKNQKHEARTTAPIFELSYSRRNNIQSEVNNQLIEVKAGYASLGFLKHASGYSEYQAGSEIKLYSIWINPDTFNSFCHSVNSRAVVDFSSFQKGGYHLRNFKTDVREESILSRLEYSLEGTEDRLNCLLLESQVLELISLNLERLLDMESLQEKPVPLSRTDMEGLVLAREILLSRLESPPSLLELSRLIQMNDCKLKKSFKLYFGKTVYEYIREQRLEKAFSLLTQERYNVSQSAFAVGYTNTSHFSRAFREKFGVNPGRVAQRNI